MAAPTGRVAVGAGVDGGGRVDQHVGGVAADGAGRAAVVGDGELDLVRAGGGEAALDLRAFEDDAVGEAPAPGGQRAVAVGGERGVEGDGVAGADDAVGAGLGGGRLVDADVDLLGAAARGEVAAVVEGDGDREDAGLLEGVRGGRAFRAGAVAEEPGGLEVLGVLGDGPGVRDAGAERRRAARGRRPAAG